MLEDMKKGCSLASQQIEKQILNCLMSGKNCYSYFCFFLKSSVSLKMGDGPKINAQKIAL